MLRRAEELRELVAPRVEHARENLRRDSRDLGRDAARVDERPRTGTFRLDRVAARLDEGAGQRIQRAGERAHERLVVPHADVGCEVFEDGAEERLARREDAVDEWARDAGALRERGDV